tara:strand:- start:2126 stop:4273 length:2148 start_codon:yes stop_codon:yes gene_type:complete
MSSISGFSQNLQTKDKKEQLYSDYIADENGNRLSGITVQVRGKLASTITNVNGEFTIRAVLGDVIELSKYGEIINTYVYDGSSQYEVLDTSKLHSSISKKNATANFDLQLDSAIYYKKNNPFKSISFIENALKSQVSKRGNSANVANAYEVLGDVYVNLKQFDLAVSNYKISIRNKSNNSVKLKLAKALSLSNYLIESNEILLSIINKKFTSFEKVEVLEFLGDNFKKLENFKQAKIYYNDALLIAKSNKITQKITALNSKIATILSVQGESLEAEIYLENSIAESKNATIKNRAVITNSVANQYRDQKNFDKEIALKKQTLQELEEADISEIIEERESDKISVQQLNLDIGNAYAKKKSYTKAIDYLEESKKKSDNVSDFETKKEAVQQLSEIYKNVGNFNKALNSYQEYVGLVDLLYKKKEKEIEDALILNKILVEKQNRINSLEKDRELLESNYKLYESEERVTVENYKRQRLIIYSLVSGLLLLLVAIYFMYKSNKQRRLANNLLALKSLRSQMNPHFIFNALNSVNGFIAQNDERTANRYLTDFSTLMRNVLDNSEQDFIPLSKEIELLKLYLKLEHSRFKDKFDYKVEIDKNLKIREYQIPPMLLQPYIENAVWHGLRYKKEKGFLKVLFYQKDDESITIEISDDGIGREKSKELKTANQQKQQSKGMDNIKKRVAILNEMYSDKVDVFIEDLYENNTGTKVVLTLKKD